MRRSTLVLLLVIVALGATCVWLWRERDLERERSDRLQAEVASLGRFPGSTPALSAAATPALLEPRKLQGSDEGGLTRHRAGFVSPEDNLKLLQDEDYLAARDDVYEAMLAMQYTGLAQVLDIPQELVDQLIAMKARQYVRELGAIVPNLADTTRDELELQRQQLHIEADAEMASLIGEGKLRKFREYEASLGERQVVRELRLELLDSSEPLAGDKSEALIGALHQERLRIAEEMAAMQSPPSINPQSMDELIAYREYVAAHQAEWDGRLLKAAGAVLSPAQMKTYRKMLEVQSRMQAAVTRSGLVRSEDMEKTP